MASKKISELSHGTTPTGSERIPGVQGGQTVSFSAQEIADLATPAGGGGLGRITVDTSGSTLTLDFNNLYGVVARAMDDVTSTAKTIAYSNDANVQDWYLYIQIDEDGSLEFPAGTEIDDVRFASPVFTPDEGSEQMVYVFHFIGDTSTGFFGHVIYAKA